MKWMMWLSFGALGGFPVYAEVIHLTNGRSMEGRIVERANGRTILDMGVGKVTLNDDKIASIEASEGKVEDQWRRKYFDHEKYLPKPLHPLAREFRSLQKVRAEALKCTEGLKGANKTIAALEKQMNGIQTALTRLDSQVQRATGNAERYRLQIQQEDLTRRYVQLHARVQTTRQEVEGKRDGVSEYLRALPAFQAQVDARRKALPEEDEASRIFFEELGLRLAEFDKDFKGMNLPHRPHGAHKLLTAKLNDAVDGEFLLDTGASFVTISEAMADRLKLPWQAAPKVRAKLADGSTIMAGVVTLDSVQIGDAGVEHVECLVTPKPPGTGIDGLLGMSFLKEFIIQIDPNTSELVLKKFAR